MNTFFTQLKNETRKIRLEKHEREAMRNTLERAMQSDAPVPSPIRLTPSPLLFFAPRLISSLAFVLVVVVVGSTSAYAAEGAVPGDLLYPLKIHVNERVAAALAVSAETKAAAHARFAERRVDEAQTLAARGSLTTKVKTELEENFEKHVVEVEAVVRAVELEDPVAAADISVRFGSSIEARSSVIARLGEGSENEENRRESASLARSLKDRGGRIARAEARTAPKVEAMRAFEAAQAPAEDAMTLSATLAVPEEDSDEAVVARIELTASTTLEEAEQYLASLKDTLDATTSARTKAQLSKIREFIKHLRERNGSTGKQKAERALKDASTVKAFIEAQDKFKDHVLLPAPDVDEGDERGNEDEHESEEEHAEENETSGLDVELNL